MEKTTIYTLDKNQEVVGKIQAKSARWNGKIWELKGVDIFEGNTGEASTYSMSAMNWRSPLTPANVIELANPEVSISAGKSRGILKGKKVGSRSDTYYQIQLQKAYLSFFTPLIMLLLAAPVAAGIRRSGTATRNLGIAIISGFGFLLTDGILLSLGEANIVPLYIAAWSATVLFASGGAWVLLTTER